jgi:hypothetical protein
MKTLVKTREELRSAGRWDIDFHLPPEGILVFRPELLRRVDAVATIAREKRDPGRTPEAVFQYLDISSVDVAVGSIATPQELEGSEAPSRARKVVRAYDLLVSTCRPTRGAIAVVPMQFHNQIASTGFSVVRPNNDINPYYLQYALRLPSTLEQFRKWSTGSSYPAILDEDVAKTLIPVPLPEEQDRIAQLIVTALGQRRAALSVANRQWKRTVQEITASLTGAPVDQEEPLAEEAPEMAVTTRQVQEVLTGLPPLLVDNGDQATQLIIDVEPAEAACG